MGALRTKIRHRWRRMHHCSKLENPPSPVPYQNSDSSSTECSATASDSDADSIPSPRSTQQDLCSVCLGLDRDAFCQRFGIDGRFPTAQLSELETSAEQGCASCTVLCAGLREFVQSPSPHGKVSIELEPSTCQEERSPLILTYSKGNDLNDSENIEFYTKDDSHSVWSSIGPAREMPPDVSSPEGIQLMRDWLAKCVAEHEGCKTDPGFLPRRVIAVLPDNREPFLYESHAFEKADYVALSHCWGKQDYAWRTPQSTAVTLEKWKQSIPMDGLPQTFRDAVTLTRRLGFKYLWIDSLCVLQDSKEDWQIHSAQMCEIYSGATVTISADSAPDCHDGIFNSMNRGRSKHMVIYPPVGKPSEPIHVRRTSLSVVKRKDYHGLADQKFTHYLPDTEPLFRRAWAMQEWLLSRRLLRFASGELTWECNKEVRCECRPERPQPCFPPRLHDPDREDFVACRNRHDNRRGMLESWDTMVEQYTSRQLTFEYDRLVALSGLAAVAVSEDAAKHYIAGHWKHHQFSESLLWSSKRTANDQHHTRHAAGYYAPTWSWASVNGPISMPPGQVVRPDFQVLDVHGIPATDNPFGPLQSGAFIKVDGLVRDLRIQDHYDQQHGLFLGGDTPKDLQVRKVLVSCCPNTERFVELLLDVDVSWPGFEISTGDTLTFILISERKGLALKKAPKGAEVSGTDHHGSIYERVALFEIADAEDCKRWETVATKQQITIV